MVLEQAGLNVSQSKNYRKTPTFCYKTSIYQRRSIFMMAFLHYDVTVVITFYTLIFNIISSIFHLVFNAFYKTLILGAKNA